MKVTSIGDVNGDHVSHQTFLRLESLLRRSFWKAGFITDVFVNGPTTMKIGLHMRSFRVDTSKLGHNADYSSSGRSCKAGYKKTDVPTWSQREQFNHLVNDAFDKLKLSATIVSGPFVIRKKNGGRIDHWSSSNAYNGGDRLFEIKALPIASNVIQLF